MKLMCTFTLRNSMNPISLSVRLLEDWQETQFLLILSLVLQLVDGLVQIAGQKISDLFIHLKTVL